MATTGRKKNLLYAKAHLAYLFQADSFVTQTHMLLSVTDYLDEVAWYRFTQDSSYAARRYDNLLIANWNFQLKSKFSLIGKDDSFGPIGGYNKIPLTMPRAAHEFADGSLPGHPFQALALVKWKFLAHRYDITVTVHLDRPENLYLDIHKDSALNWPHAYERGRIELLQVEPFNVGILRSAKNNFNGLLKKIGGAFPL